MTEHLAPLRLLIVADDPLARAGLTLSLAEQPSWTVVGQVAGETDLFSEWDIYAPDIVLWDLGWELPSPSSASANVAAKPIFETLAELREADMPLVVLLPDETHTADVWAAGVRGLLGRNVDIETLAMALLAVTKGLIVLDPLFEDSLMSAKDLLPPALSEDLTARELEVLQLLAEGLPNKAIAQRLQISDHTVKFHVNAIMTKLGAQSRTEAAVRATRLGLIFL